MCRLLSPCLLIIAMILLVVWAVITAPEPRAETRPSGLYSLVDWPRESAADPSRGLAMLRPTRPAHAAFDREAFLAAPQSYLSTADPERVHRVARAGPGVRRLQRISPDLALRPGEIIELVVQGAAAMPVTFASWDRVCFDNGTTTITVQADAAGYARTRCRPSASAYDRVEILAGSPVTSGQVRFTLEIEAASLVAAAR